MYVIKRICNDSKILKELVCEDVGGALMHFVKSCYNVLLKLSVHVDCGSCCST